MAKKTDIDAFMALLIKLGIDFEVENHLFPVEISRKTEDTPAGKVFRRVLEERTRPGALVVNGGRLVFDNSGAFAAVEGEDY